jgi:hypothetical protein
MTPADAVDEFPALVIAGERVFHQRDIDAGR